MREALNREALKRVYARLAKRYDVQHALTTAGADQRSRRLLVERTVSEGDRVLDCGAGTGTTGIMAAKKAGPSGRVTLFDLSRDMLSVARRKAGKAGVHDRVTIVAGDLERLPFRSDGFDVVLSTYSLCPVHDPERGALELYRVTRPGGKLGIAHSTEPRSGIVRWLADRVEDVAWRLPSLSMGAAPSA